MIMFTEEGKDTVTLLLFYNIWECSVLPAGNEMYFFSGGGSEKTRLCFRAAGGSLRPSLQAGGGGSSPRTGTLNERGWKPWCIQGPNTFCINNYYLFLSFIYFLLNYSN